MTYEEISSFIESLGLPCAYNEFPQNTEQEPPFICFLFDERSNDLMADDGNYMPIRPLSIELYTQNKDFELEAQIETALKGAGFPFVRLEDYIESERMYQITYETEVCITDA